MRCRRRPKAPRREAPLGGRFRSADLALLVTGALKGLYLAEAEFTGDEEMAEFVATPTVVAEVTGDRRFTGGRRRQPRGKTSPMP